MIDEFLHDMMNGAFRDAWGRFFFFGFDSMNPSDYLDALNVIVKSQTLLDDMDDRDDEQ